MKCEKCKGKIVGTAVIKKDLRVEVAPGLWAFATLIYHPTCSPEAK